MSWEAGACRQSPDLPWLRGSCAQARQTCVCCVPTPGRTDWERQLVPAEPQSSSAARWPSPGPRTLCAVQVDLGRNRFCCRALTDRSTLCRDLRGAFPKTQERCALCPVSVCAAARPVSVCGMLVGLQSPVAPVWLGTGQQPPSRALARLREQDGLPGCRVRLLSRGATQGF